MSIEAACLESLGRKINADRSLVFRQQPHIPVYELKANEDLNRHGMYVLGAIKKIVNKIDDTEYLEKLFDDLSDKHRRIGVEASGMDVFGKVFCKVMRPILLGKIYLPF